MRFLTIFFPLLFSANLFSQAIGVVMDGEFTEWQGATVVADANGDTPGLDLLELQLANDADHLFLKILAAQEFELTDGSKVVIAIDTDNNPLTGVQENGLGVELYLYPGERDVVFYGSSFPAYPSLYEAGWRHLPTVSSNTFEIALQRSAKPDGSNELLPHPSISLALWVEGSNGDYLPNAGNTIEYTFDDTPLPEYEAITFTRESADHLRLMTWNTLQNGLDDFSRQGSFKRVLSAVQPDIVTFNECWDLTAPMVASFMNSALPLGGSNSWKAVKLDQGNITVSRYPILQNWEVRPGSRLTASLIDLPATFATDILVVNGHLRCCDADGTRQLEADAFAAFLNDAKTTGGLIDLPEGTPIVLSGDLNLVGWRQQLETLLTGEVVNTNTYGPGGPPDWDGTALADALPLHTHQPVAFTWQSPFSSYPPSRLDYIIFANSVMQLAKGFVIRTDELPPDVLGNYGILASDSENASDHNPVVADFILPMATATAESAGEVALTVRPNPFTEQVIIESSRSDGPLAAVVVNMDGKVLWEGTVNGSLVIPAGSWPAGIYFLRVNEGRRVQTIRLVKLR